MRIFVMGASGFIGSRACDALAARGHDVLRAGRPVYDVARDHHVAAWKDRLKGFDVAINAVGIFRERGRQTFEAVQDRGPRAMFEACAALGVAVIQFSALGADADADTEFLRSKQRADEALLASGARCVVLQPSLVYGEAGASAGLFRTLASLPLVPLPSRGEQRVQPVHIDDVADAVVAIVEGGRFAGERVALVGPEAITLRELLADLRFGMGLGAARFVEVPAGLVEVAARMGIAGMLDCDAWRMLRRGNTASAAAMTALLGRSPRPASDFIPGPMRQAIRRDAQLAWLLALLRISIAIVWITAAVVSAGLYPVADSLALVARTGIHGMAAYAALYGAALLDLALGVASLALRRRRMLWLLQMLVIALYTVIITVDLPEQWLHPYGPVVKNLPMLAALALLYTMERR